MKTYVVIDVEMCRVQKAYGGKAYPYSNEIIQIGAVMMDESYQMIEEFSTYVCPVYGKVDCFIKNLTGITEKDVRTAPSLEEALRSMLLWIGDREVSFYAWSDTDYFQIRREIRAKGMDAAEMAVYTNPDNWIDYQKTIEKRFKLGRLISLPDALDLAELDQEGRLHDGLVDAYNTARIITEIELHPDKKYALERFRQKEEARKPLGYSLGGLLQGLFQESA